MNACVCTLLSILNVTVNSIFSFQLFVPFSRFCRVQKEPPSRGRRLARAVGLPRVGHQATHRFECTLQRAAGTAADLSGRHPAETGGASPARGDETDQDPCSGMPPRPRGVHGMLCFFVFFGIRSPVNIATRTIYVSGGMLCVSPPLLVCSPLGLCCNSYIQHMSLVRTYPRLRSVSLLSEVYELLQSFRGIVCAVFFPGYSHTTELIRPVL